MSERLDQLTYFYSILDRLEQRIGGARLLSETNGRLEWPPRGVYFVREHGENRTDSGAGPRVVRVGTHALTAGSQTKLWTRLSQHRGRRLGGGNHRGSIFRLLVGQAIVARDSLVSLTWGVGSTGSREIRESEQELERRVSAIIGNMSILWLGVDDEAGPDSRRGHIERNAIALLSNYDRPALDAPSPGWLGRSSDRRRVRESGLWNSNHVDEQCEPDFLDRMEQLVTRVGPA